MLYDKLLSQRRIKSYGKMSLTPNQQLFEYRVVRVLGQGAFGAVYLVTEYLAGGSLRILLGAGEINEAQIPGI